MLRGLPFDEDPEPVRQRRLAEQVERMDQIVAYQLRRAAAAGSRIWHGRVVLEPQLRRVGAALAKVYRDKRPEFRFELEPGFSLPLEQGDLMELFGNLLDNACKHCRSRVRVSAGQDEDRLRVAVEDDGAGFPGSDPQQLLQRGVRLDSRHEGQGFGLALVDDIVSAAGGSVRLGRSELGGARVEVEFPQ